MNEIRFVPCNESDGDLSLFDKDMERIFVKFLLYFPKGLELIRQELQTDPLLLAFEYAKRRYEYNSGRLWGKDREILPYCGRSRDYTNAMGNMCDELVAELDGVEFDTDFLAEYIQEKCQEKPLQPNVTISQKYAGLDLPLDKNLLILVSGYPDAGKTRLSYNLQGRFKSAFLVDSDFPPRGITPFVTPLEEQFGGGV